MVLGAGMAAKDIDELQSRLEYAALALPGFDLSLGDLRRFVSLRPMPDKQTATRVSREGRRVRLGIFVSQPYHS